MRKRPTFTRMAVACAAVAMLATTGQASAEPATTASPGSSPPELIHVTGTDEDPVTLATRLAERGFDVVGREGAEVVVLGTDRTRVELGREGARTVRSRPVPRAAGTNERGRYPLPRRLSGREYPTYYGGYRTVEAYHRFVADVAQRYPDLTRRVEYGDSWKRSRDLGAGNDLEALCITATAPLGCRTRPESAKPRLLVMAQIHAREVTTSEMAWRLVSHLLDGYRTDPEVTAVLQGTEVWVVPQVNPDGIETVQEGLASGDVSITSKAWQRKNLNDTNSAEPCSGPWQRSQEGIDLNRNWDSHWNQTGVSREPCSLVYNGPEAASEPEVSSLAGLFERLFPDQRGPGEDDAAPPTTRGAMITIHTYGNLVLFPWGTSKDTKAPNDAGLRSMAFRMGHFNGYEAGQPPEVLYQLSGSTDDWAYDKLGIPGFTYEIGSGSGDCGGFHPAYRCQDAFWELNRPALMYAAKVARQPYTMAQGPTVSDVVVQRSHGQWAAVTAEADDDAYGKEGVARPAAQKVVEAEVYVGRAPWEGGRAQRIDVRGDGSTVDIGGVFNTVGDIGWHRLIYVRAKDADGNWGPVTTAWLPPRVTD
ncbi:hypothetical protein GCM10012275_52390 [Longimycelium tulufanense]|uniref:Peptidase M14 domain-containing protein n=1 Tax=Longimycelium tulufanense TaxID=907463 RepID=A0A8J3CCU2_9PSEU|nr:M14 family zinc carboxypeptidase [Longimycelium tulufanense]GGM75217.1 hypothetical protein GCM10012275_52390 [Longimycelium tulufanense]